MRPNEGYIRLEFEAYSDYDVVGGFNRVAPRYDLANDLITLGLHRRWRSELCRAASRHTPRGGKVLDIATGTGEVIFQLAAGELTRLLVGLDPSRRMVEQASRKSASRLPESVRARVSFREGDACALPFPDASFDTVTISWGIRNIHPRDTGLREAFRVLRSDGRLFILESGVPEHPTLRKLHSGYSRVLPLIGRAVTGYRPAYQFYTHTASLFPSGQAFLDELEGAGFENRHYKALSGGIVYLYSAARGSRDFGQSG